MNLDDYSRQVLQETIAAAEVDSVPRVEAFTQAVLQRLSTAGEFDSGQVAYHRKTGVEVSGWDHDPDCGVLHALVTVWSGEAPPGTLTAAVASQATRRLVGFLERCGKGYADRLEESDPVWELADLVARERTSFREVRLYLLTDLVGRRLRPPAVSATVLGVPATLHVWDLERLFRLDTSGLEREPITVSIGDFQDHPLPVLEGPDGGDHKVYLAIVSGRLLADLYDTYGARLLERNVRSFLQARGAVNKGIRETILYEPQRFLAYNNGISATAADVSTVHLEDGRTAIVEIKDLQIVNGGQTTASLHAARDRGDLDRIALQAKLTVVQPDLIDAIVPSISRYSNTQNKVTGADFSANHPFHVRVEELSRTVWAPAPDGSQRQTRWFYERARGQYADELLRAGTVARQKQFRTTSPPTQKYTKTDLAKFLNTWNQLPHVVSLGAEKNFREFMLRLEEHPIEPDVEWFHRLVACAILFRSAEKIVQRQKFGGYRAQIVTYTLAKLAHATQHRVDLEAVWRAQAPGPAVAEAIASISVPIHEVITQPSGRVRHVGEWAKKLDCWRAAVEVPVKLPAALEAELIMLNGAAPTTGASAGVQLSAADRAVIAEVAAVPGETWLQVAHWAKETDNLQGWQRRIAFSVGTLLNAERSPSIKQAVQAKKLYDEARRLGFAGGMGN